MKRKYLIFHVKNILTIAKQCCCVVFFSRVVRLLTIKLEENGWNRKSFVTPILLFFFFSILFFFFFKPNVNRNKCDNECGEDDKVFLSRIVTSILFKGVVLNKTDWNKTCLNCLSLMFDASEKLFKKFEKSSV